MKTTKAIPAGYKQPWMPQPQQFMAETFHDDETDLITFTLPNGADVTLSYDALRSMFEGIETRFAADRMEKS